MSRLSKRLIIPVFLLLVAVVLLFLESLTTSGAQYKTHIIDTISHMGTQDEISPPIVQQVPKPALKEPLAVPIEAKEEAELVLDPCTVINPNNHAFIDLRGLLVLEEKKPQPWPAKGYDSGLNFTLGICANPWKRAADVTEITDSVNVTSVGAYYMDAKTEKYVSIGEYSTTPKFRGKKLTLTYQNGSYCENLVNSKTGQRLRKSTIITFTCDREMMAKASISYIGSSNDCSYYFDVRSHHACPTAAKSDNLAVIWIFLLILLAALFVYFSGGILYKQMKRYLPKF